MLDHFLGWLPIPESAWAYIAGIIGAISGGIGTLLIIGNRNHTNTLLLNQEIIKRQVLYTSEQQQQAVEQQRAAMSWLSAQLNEAGKKIAGLEMRNQELEERNSQLEIEYARLIERLDTKDFG